MPFLTELQRSSGILSKLMNDPLIMFPKHSTKVIIEISKMYSILPSRFPHMVPKYYSNSVT